MTDKKKISLHIRKTILRGDGLGIIFIFYIVITYLLLFIYLYTYGHTVAGKLNKSKLLKSLFLVILIVM